MRVDILPSVISIGKSGIFKNPHIISTSPPELDLRYSRFVLF